jgi:broad specificity phosphatase PhoE
VYLVRHGAVDLTTPGMTFPKDCFYGGHDVPLSTIGKEEAQVRVPPLVMFGVQGVQRIASTKEKKKILFVAPSRGCRSASRCMLCLC